MKIYLTGILLLLQMVVFAQSPGINGRILDEHSQSLPSAAVVILRAADSLKVKALMTDSLGYFKVTDIPVGKYLIQVNYIGYSTHYSKAFELTELKKHYHYGEIHLMPDSRTLNTIVISGSPPVITQNLDKTTMNVEKSIMATGSTALELLSKAPGLNVSENGDISLKGRSGTSVMINGKLTYLSGNQLATLLRGTSSSAISKIEIISNPSAGYDATGSGGIVNIVLKKNMQTGFNGSLSGNMGSGRSMRYGSTGSLNYRTNLLNVFGSYDLSMHTYKSYTDTERSFYNPQAILVQQSSQHSAEEAKLRSHNFRAGIDLSPDEKNTIGFLLNGAVGRYPMTEQTAGYWIDAQKGTPLWNAVTQTQGRERWTDLLYNMNYVHRFSAEGHELRADLDYVTHFSKMEQQLNTRYTSAIGTAPRHPGSRRGDIPSNNDIYVAKLDYVLPLRALGKLETGWKGSLVRTENNLRYDTLQNQQYVPDAGISNHFIYKENIQAAYVHVKKEWKSYSLQIGLRGEYTYTQGHQLTTDSLQKRKYFQLFPSISVRHQFNEQHKLQMGYSRRIQRPGYWDLNPFRVYTDPFSFYEGNAYLKPALVNAFELGYQFKARYFAALSYNRTHDVIGEKIGLQEPGQITFERPDNLGHFSNYGLSITAGTSLGKWLTGSQFVNFYHNSFDIDNLYGREKRSGNTLAFNSQNTLVLGKGWRAELNAFYQSSEVLGTSKIKAYHRISAGLQKEVMKGKGNIKFMMNDIFKGDNRGSYTAYGQVSSYSKRNRDSRIGILSFTYNFGNQGLKMVDRSTGSEELKGRMK